MPDVLPPMDDDTGPEAGAGVPVVDCVLGAQAARAAAIVRATRTGRRDMQVPGLGSLERGREERLRVTTTKL
jgi:hypothetical protein